MFIPKHCGEKLCWIYSFTRNQNTKIPITVPMMLQYFCSPLSLEASLRFFSFYTEFKQNQQWSGYTTQPAIRELIPSTVCSWIQKKWTSGTSVGFHAYSTPPCTASAFPLHCRVSSKQVFLGGKLVLCWSKDMFAIHIRWAASVHSSLCGSILNGPFSQVIQVP